ncbi:hypothetical protein H2248_010252 [Termitomyces sp. 'cryptogamus']|nr:hypothetical protein H2248_010252 [Termitomyces sp. 'cryptogamus']
MLDIPNDGVSRSHVSNQQRNRLALAAFTKATDLKSPYRASAVSSPQSYKFTHPTPMHVISSVHLEIIHYLACASEEEAPTSMSTSTLSMGTGAGGKVSRRDTDALEPVGQPSHIIVLLSTVLQL